MLGLKNTIIIVVLFIMSLTGCGVYKEGGPSKIYFSKDIDAFIEEGHFTTNRPEKIPKKLLRTLNKSCSLYAADTALVHKYDYYNHLLLFGINQEGKKGYIITGGQKGNSCQLFSIDKGRVQFRTYHTPKTATTWADTKSHLIIKNQLMFGGGVIIKHPFRKQREAFSK